MTVGRDCVIGARCILHPGVVIGADGFGFALHEGEWIKIERSEIDALPAHSKELVETYCLFDEDHYYVPDYGFKVMDIVNFLNHDDVPNIISINDGEDFETLREIKAGEELFIDYGKIVDSEE